MRSVSAETPLELSSTHVPSCLAYMFVSTGASTKYLFTEPSVISSVVRSPVSTTMPVKFDPSPKNASAVISDPLTTILLPSSVAFKDIVVPSLIQKESPPVPVPPSTAIHASFLRP